MDQHPAVTKYVWISLGYLYKTIINSKRKPEHLLRVVQIHKTIVRNEGMNAMHINVNKRALSTMHVLSASTFINNRRHVDSWHTHGNRIFCISISQL